MGCGCNNQNCLLPIILGIIGGILGVLFITTIPQLVPFLWIVFGISILSIIILVGNSVFEGISEERNKCTCKKGACVLLGAFGSLIASIFAISLGTLTTILTFFLIGFFVWLIVALFLYTLCLIKNTCD